MKIELYKQKAKLKHKENNQFLDLLQKKKPTNLDKELLEIHNNIFNKINCLDCANCCKTTGPLLLEKDIDIIAKNLKIKPRDFIEKYLRKDEENDWVFKSMPCPFLDSDNYCQIYNSRPKACREYPHTDRRKFYQINHLTIKNIEICPAAFEIIENLKEKFSFAIKK